jgi:hypothetical protein
MRPTSSRAAGLAPASATTLPGGCPGGNRITPARPGWVKDERDVPAARSRLEPDPGPAGVFDAVRQDRPDWVVFG